MNIIYKPKRSHWKEKKLLNIHNKETWPQRFLVSTFFVWGTCHFKTLVLKCLMTNVQFDEYSNQFEKFKKIMI